MREEKVRQHYVPVHQLSEFSNDEDLIWCFDKLEEKIFKTSPRNVAVENYFYDGPDDPPEMETWLENLESAVGGEDGPYNKAVQAGEVSLDILTSKEIQLFSLYVVVQELRTRSWRDTFDDLARQVQEKIGDAASDELNSEISDFRTEETLREFHNGTLKDKISDYSEILIRDFYWRIHENKTDKEIWTSDNPVFRHNTERENARGSHGLLSSGVEIYLPLTPNHILHLLDKSAYDVENSLLSGEFHDPKIIEFINDAQVQGSTRHIFSNTSDFSLAERRLKDTPEVGDPDRNLTDIRFGSL